MTEDTRWKQRFANFKNAFAELAQGVELAKTRPLTRLEQQGVIQGFEYTHELAWNVLKDYLEFFGHVGLIGSRDATREAFLRGLIEEGQVWMDMIQSRNLTSHAYNQKTAQAVYQSIVDQYFPAFLAFNARFEKLQ